MSLDVYIKEEPRTEEYTCRDCDNKHTRTVTESVYSDNITHNLTTMAGAANLYQALWRPEELGITLAHQLIPLLTVGLAALKQDPEKFKKFNPENGWGSYEHLVDFTESYLLACQKYPNLKIEVSR